MKGLFTALAAMFMVVGCQAQQPPTQVIYRFDDHRYLELKGWTVKVSFGIRIAKGKFTRKYTRSFIAFSPGS
ncbi:Uncharacterised protein (plasmid) [Klebsiella aerogenes]|nr:Uncharacterised protein [Klebsiella aerogenes]